DRRITAAAAESGWTADRLGAVERNILRIAVHELDAGEVPPAAVIDEAVRLAKQYSTREAGRAGKAILGNIHRERGAWTAPTARSGGPRSCWRGSRRPEPSSNGSRRTRTSTRRSRSSAGCRSSRRRWSRSSSARSVRARRMRSPDELRELVESHLAELALTPQLGRPAETVPHPA